MNYVVKDVCMNIMTKCMKWFVIHFWKCSKLKGYKVKVICSCIRNITSDLFIITVKWIHLLHTTQKRRFSTRARAQLEVN